MDHRTFEEGIDRHRREVHIHCYRMLASFDEAEDAVQETLLRAWRARSTLEDPALFRAWLYRIATNVCLDLLRGRTRHRHRMATPAEVPSLQPYPDRLIDEGDPPDEEAVRRETIELAFLVALQVLPPRQRAVLLLRDVLGLTAAETAGLMDVTVPAANSALQRARATMRDNLPSHRSQWTAAPSDDEERRLLEHFIDAHERLDPEAALAAVTSNIRVTMPPYPHQFDGVDDLMPLLRRGLGPDREGDWRLLPTRCNRMPAAASYVRKRGDTLFRPRKLDVLRVEEGLIAEITTLGPEKFPLFALPETV